MPDKNSLREKAILDIWFWKLIKGLINPTVYLMFFSGIIFAYNFKTGIYFF
jgi:hypothetical protein